METKHFKIPIQSRIAFFQISEEKWVSIYNFVCIVVKDWKWGIFRKWNNWRIVCHPWELSEGSDRDLDRKKKEIETR